MSRLSSISLPGARSWAAFAIGAALLFLVVRTALLGFVDSRPGSLDDAFICLVYARHLVSTGRIFYDPRDGALDGFTSMLDVLVKSLGMLVPSSDAITAVWWEAAVLQGLVAAVGFALGVLLFSRTKAPKINAVLAGALLGFAIAANPALAYGSSFLLETPLYVLLVLVTSSIFLVSPRPFSTVRLAGFVASMSALTLARPEGIAIALVLGAATLLDARVATKRQRVTAGAVFAAFVFAYYVFHRAYFGAWAPNSYYAKTSASRMNEIRDGLEYVSQYFHSNEGWLLFSLLPGAVACLIPRWRKPELRVQCACISLVALMTLLMVVVSGGDGYRGGRFMAAPLCLGAVAMTTAAAGLLPTLRYGALALLAGMAAVEMTPFVSPSSNTALWRKSKALHPARERRFACDALIARRLADIVRGGVIAQTDYQRLKYFADDARVFDASGLNNREIAHTSSTDPILWGRLDYVDLLARAPEVFLFGHHTRTQQTALSDHSLREALKDRKLRQRYFGYRFEVKEADVLPAAYVSGSIRICNGYFNILIHRDFVEKAREAGVRVGS